MTKRMPIADDYGEVRLVDRLEYHDPRGGVSSRMPTTVAVVIRQMSRANERGG